MSKKAITLLVLLACGYGYTSERCIGGGEGGGLPFSIIPENIAQNPNFVKTGKLLTDFIFWEGINRIIYHDQFSNLISHHLDSDIGYSLGTVPANTALSRVIDNKYNFFTDTNNGIVYSAAYAIKKKMPHPMPQKELFWTGNILFSVSQKEYESGRGISRIYAYSPDSNWFSSCNVDGNGYIFHPAETSEYPYLHGYDFRPANNGKDEYNSFHLFIDVYKALKNKKCEVKLMNGYEDAFPGKIQKMYHYTKLKANTYVLDNPKKKLLWDLGVEECIYYNTEDMNFEVLRSDVPAVAMWSQEEGLNILYTRRTKKIGIPHTGQYGVDKKDFALSKNGKKLFISQKPEANSGSLKALLQFDLEEVP